MADKVLDAPDAPPGLRGVPELFPGLYTGLRRRVPEATPGELLRIVTRLLAAEHGQAVFGVPDGEWLTPESEPVSRRN